MPLPVQRTDGRSPGRRPAGQVAAGRRRRQNWALSTGCVLSLTKSAPPRRQARTRTFFISAPARMLMQPRPASTAALIEPAWMGRGRTLPPSLARTPYGRQTETPAAWRVPQFIFQRAVQYFDSGQAPEHHSSPLSPQTFTGSSHAHNTYACRILI